MNEALAFERKALPKASYRNDVLKILAMATMLVDHIDYMYFPGEMTLRTIGRIAFPIFAYQIAVGYSKTSNLKKYVQRLFIFALITQVPYSFFNPQLNFQPIEFNVLFMFLAAVLDLYVYDKGINSVKSFIKSRNFMNLLLGILFFICTLAIIIAPEVAGFYVKEFGFEYGALGISMVLAFHIFQENKAAAITSIILLYFFHGYYWAALYASPRTAKAFWDNFFNFKYVWRYITFNNGLMMLRNFYFNARGVFALIPIYLLQRIDTSRIRLNKYAGYVFYPAHIALIVVIMFIIKVF